MIVMRFQHGVSVRWGGLFSHVTGDSDDEVVCRGMLDVLRRIQSA